MANIELVIKIPEEVYKASQIIDIKHEDVIQIPLEVIAKGTPLPKRHGRLIDVDTIIYEKECVYFSDGSCTTESTPNISATPTIIEASKEQEDD